ncbi:MAG: hypothetical protein P8183_09860, partial [Anaerolineae bacterium]
MIPETNPTLTTPMDPTQLPLPQGSPVHEEEVDSIYVAPNWKLVWWRFKKHRLAVASTFIVILVAIVAIIPG